MKSGRLYGKSMECGGLRVRIYTISLRERQYPFGYPFQGALPISFGFTLLFWQKMRYF